MRTSALLVLLFVLIGLIISCASQKPPSGGPGDKLGPVLIAQYPQNGTTNYNENEVRFFFNEFINRSTVVKALKIEPDLGIKTTVKQGRKSFSVIFENPLPENTTVIVQLGNELTDTFNNKLGSPSTIAFSTGDRIDKGALSGAIYSAETGRGEAGLKVLLFDNYVNEPEKAAKYIAETDTAGVFQFDYLAEGIYTAIWVDDANRNRKLERDREYYSTFMKEAIEVKSDSIAILPPLYITKEDTIAPLLYETGLLTQQRLNLMFSEDVYFSDTTRIAVEDSTGRKIEAYPLYTDADAKQKLIAHTVEPLSDENMKYRVNINAILDEANNAASIIGNWFDGTVQKDTVQQRIIAYGIKNEYFFDEPLKFRYAKPFMNTALRDSFFVNAQTEMFKPWDKISSNGNELTVYPDSLWDLEGLTFNLWDPSSLSFAAYNPTIWTENKLGSIRLSFDGTISTDSLTMSSNESKSDSLSPKALNTYEVRVYDENMKLYHSGTFIDSLKTANYIIERLPAKPLSVVVFNDANLNGLYDIGKVGPFSPPENYYLQSKVDVRSGFETTIKVDFSMSLEKLVQKLKALQMGSKDNDLSTKPSENENNDKRLEN